MTIDEWCRKRQFKVAHWWAVPVESGMNEIQYFLHIWACRSSTYGSSFNMHFMLHLAKVIVD